MLLWTLIFLGLDYADSLLGVRDYWLDWLLAAAAILFHSAGVWYIALLLGAKVSHLADGSAALVFRSSLIRWRRASCSGSTAGG